MTGQPEYVGGQEASCLGTDKTEKMSMSHKSTGQESTQPIIGTETSQTHGKLCWLTLDPSQIILSV